MDINFTTSLFDVHCNCRLSGLLTYRGRFEYVALLNKQNVNYIAVARYLYLCEYSKKTAILPNLYVKASKDIES